MLYDWILVLHIAAWTSWMAGLFYLPRLFVYHAETAPAGSAQSETFKTMEQKLLRLIMNPAMIVTWITGLALGIGGPGLDFSGGWFLGSGWLHAKLALVILMSGFHGYCAARRRAFAEDRNTKSGRHYRIANEVPTVLFLGIVILAVIKPF